MTSSCEINSPMAERRGGNTAVLCSMARRDAASPVHTAFEACFVLEELKVAGILELDGLVFAELAMLMVLEESLATGCPYLTGLTPGT